MIFRLRPLNIRAFQGLQTGLNLRKFLGRMCDNLNDWFDGGKYRIGVDGRKVESQVCERIADNSVQGIFESKGLGGCCACLELSCTKDTDNNLIMTCYEDTSFDTREKLKINCETLLATLQLL